MADAPETYNDAIDNLCDVLQAGGELNIPGVGKFLTVSSTVCDNADAITFAFETVLENHENSDGTKKNVAKVAGKVVGKLYIH